MAGATFHAYYIRRAQCGQASVATTPIGFTINTPPLILGKRRPIKHGKVNKLEVELRNEDVFQPGSPLTGRVLVDLGRTLW